MTPVNWIYSNYFWLNYNYLEIYHFAHKYPYLKFYLVIFYFLNYYVKSNLVFFAEN